MTSGACPVSGPIRVLVDEAPGSGEWNMAVDAVLLESAVSAGVCSLRWYRWEEPTLSLGHFQSTGAITEGRFAGLPRVRRPSGGGAILHDQELTYSCAIGPQHPLASHPAGLYETMHGAIVGVLSKHGVTARPRGTTDRHLDAHFLCFSRGDVNDLVIGPHKVLGSAQRRRRGAVLQHGSLLLERSRFAPEYPGVMDLCEVHVNTEELLATLVRRTSEVLGRPIERGDLTQEEFDKAWSLASAAVGRPESSAFDRGDSCLREP